MKKIFSALAVIITASLVFAAPVEESSVSAVAKGWCIQNAKAFGQLGEYVGTTVETNAQGEAMWYVVKFEEGAAIVAPDDEIEPVIAVLPKSDGVIAKGTPLRAMLERDLQQRKENLVQTGGAKLLSSAVGKQSKWRRLAAIGNGMKMLNSSGNPATIVKWLDGWKSANKQGGVQTLRFWNQNGSSNYFSNKEVFDLYTPTYNNGSTHAACGCVATAGSVIMHYFRVPSGNSGLEYGCSSSDKSLTLTTKGGVYDWSLIDDLNLISGTKLTLSEDALDLLARVAYDCGVGCEMAYNLDGEGSSGTYTYKLQQSFRKVFNVKHAQLVTLNGSLYGSGDIGNYVAGIYNQIRAGAPVAMGIEGHEVVACGYGIDSDNTDYTYVFMGWGGAYDAWYALPKIETKATSGGSTYVSTVIDEIITAISVDNDNYIPLVGKLVDADGEPVAGGVVTLSTGEQLTSDENGYWGTRVSPSAERYVMDKNGERHIYTIGSTAEKTTDSAVTVASWSSAIPEAMEIIATDPTVMVYDGATLFSKRSSINRALEDAAGLADAKLVVSNAATLRVSSTIDFKCAIEGWTEDGSMAEIQIADGCQLTVGNGGTLSLNNIAFDGGVKKVEVAAGGKLVLAGPVDFDTAIAEGAAIHTADSTGLVLAAADAIPSAFAISCDAAQLADQQFGTWETIDFDTVTNIVRNIWSADDPEREIGGWAMQDGRLIWRQTETTLEAAAGWFVDATGHTNCYGRLERALERFETALNGGTLCENPEFVIRHGNTLTKNFAITTNVTFRGEGELIALTNLASTAGFVVSNGTLTIRNLKFNGYGGEGLFQVRGGNLALEDSQLVNIEGKGSGSGAISVYKGKATINRATFDNCRAIGYYNKQGRGGAVYVAGDCEVMFADTLITNCYAASYGGAVYASCLAKIGIGGNMRVRGNRCGSASAFESNIYLVETDTVFEVESELTGIQSVGVSSPNYEDGQVFAKLSSSLRGKEEQIDHTCAALYNDFNGELTVVDPNRGKSGADTQLAWSTVPDNPQTTEDLAVAQVSGAGEPIDGFYKTIEGAFNSIATDGATVTILENCSLASSVTLTNSLVALKSKDGETLTITRTGDDAYLKFQSAVTITNLNLCGCADGETKVEGAFLLFDGAKATLANGVTITRVYGRETRADCAVVAYDGAKLMVEDGVLIENCYNYLTNPSDSTGHGGAIMVEKSTLRLNGGTIRNCGSYIYGGGVFAGSQSDVYIDGKVNIIGNVANDDGLASNLTLSDNSTLHLSGALDGSVGVKTGFSADTNVFGQVDASFPQDFTALTNSAASFVNDETGAYGCAATNVARSAMLLVWSKAIKSDGSYTDEQGNVYYVVGDIPHNEITVHPVEIAFKSIMVDADRGKYIAVLTNMVRGCWYSFYVTNSLSGGFKIEGIEPNRRFQAESDGEYTFETNSLVPATYIRATAIEGVIVP